jgi:predicted permease
VLGAFEPIWILTIVGYLARRFRLLGADAASTLGRFVFHLAMPAALFLTMAGTPLDRFAGRGLIAFGLSSAAVIGLGWLVLAGRFGRTAGERPIWGMAAGYVNSANLGIPIARQVLGNVSFLAEVILLQVLVITPIILIALDRQAHAGRLHLRRVVTMPLRNPVIVGSALGVVCSAAGWPLPAVVRSPLALLSAAAVPMALVALGASLQTVDADAESATGAVELGVIVSLKLIAQPVVTYTMGRLLGLSPAELLAAVVCSGLPTAQNTFIYATEYRAGVALAGRAVAVSTTLSLATLATLSAMIPALGSVDRAPAGARPAAVGADRSAAQRSILRNMAYCPGWAPARAGTVPTFRHPQPSYNTCLDVARGLTVNVARSSRRLPRNASWRKCPTGWARQFRRTSISASTAVRLPPRSSVNPGSGTGSNPANQSRSCGRLYPNTKPTRMCPARAVTSSKFRAPSAPVALL